MGDINFVNCTPHAITVLDNMGNPHVFAPSGRVPRVLTVDNVDWIGNFAVKTASTLSVSDMPDPAPNTVYVVSAMAKAALTGRSDVMSPDTSPTGAIRDDKGQIVAVKGFIL